MQSTASDLYGAYAKWCEANGYTQPASQKVFGGELTRRGFERGKVTGGPNRGRGNWVGIGIRSTDLCD